VALAIRFDRNRFIKEMDGSRNGEKEPDALYFWPSDRWGSSQLDYHRLGLGTASSLVRSVRLVHWGAIVLVDCIYDPLGDQKAYQLSFQGCSQIRIDMVPDQPAGKHEPDLIGISLGQEEGLQPAVLTTDLFELHVTYQQFECQALTE
jgi:hypothetical protein